MTTTSPDMKVKAIAPWFGCNRVAGARVGEELGKLAWCGVPFCGGCPELPFIQTRGGICADLHRHLINLARVVRDPALIKPLIDRLNNTLFHPEEFNAAHGRLRAREQCFETGNIFAVSGLTGPDGDLYPPDLSWAADYFVACWMGRGGHAGKTTEFSQNLAVRWTASGGDSAIRFRSATEALRGWNASLNRWQFETIGVFDFLDRVADREAHGLYLDPPWPDLGEEYKHRFSERDQVRLAERLRAFKNVRIVLRFGDHPLTRELYPASFWRWEMASTRNQQNNGVQEALIVNGPRLTEAAK